MAQTIDNVKAELVQKVIRAILYGDKRASGPGFYEPRKVTAQYICQDGRTRNKFWKELIAGRYVTEVFAGYPVEAGVGYVTDKAFDELPVAPVDLTRNYKFDAWDAKKGVGDYASWDRLNVSEQKAVILAMRADPASYTLMMVDWRSNPVVKARFALGEVASVKDVVDTSDCTLSVSNPALEAMHAQHRRDHHKSECLNAGLNWYLHSILAIDPETTIPVCEKQPFFGSGSAVQRDPKAWRESLPATIEATKEEIKRARMRLEALQQWETVVDKAGGWDAFLSQYDAAIEGYVVANPGV